MGNKDKVRRCKACGKLLLDEKLPFCRRCVLEGRNKVGKVGTVGTIGLSVLSVISNLQNSNSNDNSTA